eukprot:m.287094 g.287094  ORF g.287094 m.287094 type:complete len:2187 (+) comp17784_c0_seq1:6580-13140(+)
MRRASLGDDTTSWDYNNDGVVTVGDALMLLQYTTGEVAQAPGSVAAMDADLNGEVSLNDVVFILDTLAGRVRRVTSVEAVGVQDLTSDCFIRVSVTVDASVGASGPAAVEASTQLYSGLVADNGIQTTLTELYSTFGISEPTDKLPNGGFAALNDVTTNGQLLTYTAQRPSTYSRAEVLAVNPWQFVGPQGQDPVSDFFHTGSLNTGAVIYPGFNSTTVRQGLGSAFLPNGYAGVINFASTETTAACRAQRAPVIANLAKVTTDGTQATLTITAPQIADQLNVSQYVVQWRVLDCGDARLRVDCVNAPFNVFGEVPSQQMTTTTTGSPVTISGLQPFITYEVRVVLEVTSGSTTRLSVASNPETVQTAQDEPSQPPSVVSVGSPTASSLTVTYTQIALPQTNGQTTYFVLASRVAGQPKEQPSARDVVNGTMSTQGDDDARTLSYELTGLESNINYEIEVFAVNTEGSTALSSTVVDAGTFKTAPSPPEDAPVLAQTATDVTNSSMRVSWAEPIKHTHNVDTLLYHVAYRQADVTSYVDGTSVSADSFADYNGTNFTVIEGLTDLNVVLTDLNPAMDYIVKIKAYGIQNSQRFDDDEFSTEVVYRTADFAPVGPPTNVDLLPSSATSLTLQWKLPLQAQRNGLITAFAITYALASGADARLVDSATDVTAGCPSLQCTQQFNATVVVNKQEAVMEVVVSQLEEFVDYTFTIQATTSAGTGPSATATTRTLPAAPKQPVAVVVSSKSATQLAVTITPPVSTSLNGPLTGYFVSIAPDTENGNFSFRHDANHPLPQRTEVTAPGALDGDTRVVIFGDGTTPLQAYMSYIITIEPFNRLSIPGRNEDLFGNSTGVIAKTEQATPTAGVTNLTIVETNNVASTEKRTLKATWSLPLGSKRNGIITSFSLTYTLTSPSDLASAVASSVASGSTSVQVPPGQQGQAEYSAEFEQPDLAAFATYTFTVRPLNQAATDSLGPDVSAFITTTPYKPTDPVSNLSLSTFNTGVTAGESRIDVTFNRPPVIGRHGASARYTVAVQQLDSQYAASRGQRSLGTIDMTDSNSNAQSLLIAGRSGQPQLEAFVEYSITVTPFNNDPTDAGPSITKTIRAAAARPGNRPGTPTFPTIVADRMVVSWNPIATSEYNAIETDITYSAQFNRLQRTYLDQDGTTKVLAAASNVTVVQRDVSRVTFNGLQPYTEYSINVRARNQEGDGTSSSTVIARTLSARPTTGDDLYLRREALSDPDLSERTHMQVSWDAVSNYDGPVRQVQVIVEPEDAPTYNVARVDCGNGRTSCDFGTYAQAEAADFQRAWVAYDETYEENADPTDTAGKGVVIGSEEEPLKAGKTYTLRLLVCTDNNGEALCQASILDPRPEDPENPFVGSIAKTKAAPSSNNSGVLIAVIIVLLLIILGGAVLYYRKHQATKKPDDTFWGNDTGTPTTDPSGFAQPIAPSRGTQPGTSVGLVPVRNSLSGANPVRNGGAAPALPQKASRNGSAAPAAIPGVPTLPPVDRHDIAVPDLHTVIQQMSANSDFAFSEEYECIETGNEFPRTYALLDHNRMKNRFANILAYDYTRVHLAKMPNDPYSDYINANFIDGHNSPNHYIAAQGPLPHTVMDFWRMLWEQRTNVIVMVTNLEEKGRVKCHRYWPQSEGQPLQLTTNMSITMDKQEEFPDIVIRHLTVQVAEQSRVITQFHYISWPDHGVPDSTAGILTTIRRAKAERNKPNAGPMVVHCSAGVGRTGTLLAIDYNMDRAAQEGRIDVFGTLNTMRRQRTTMVQTEAQYIFIYRALADALSNTVTEMSPPTLRKHFATLKTPVPSGGTQLDQEFKRLTQGPPPTARTDSAQQLANKSKNRFQNILPYDQSRVKLTALPGVVGSDYINASFIDGFKRKAAFIATQGPIKDTVADFWRMVWDQEVNSIVMLTQLEENGRSKSEQYWPSLGSEPLSVGDLQVQTTGEEHMGYCLERTLLLVNPVSDQAREIKHWQFTSWPSSGEMGSGRDLVDLMDRVEAYGKSKVVVPQEESIYGNQETITEQAVLKQLKPTVVHCSAGVGRTGAYCAAVICLQRMKEEQRMDLYQVTKHLRTQRPGMIQTPDQYMFVYRVVLDYLDMNDTPAIMASDSLYSTPLSQPAFAENAYMGESSVDPDSTRVLSLNENSGPPPALPAKSRDYNLNEEPAATTTEDDEAYGFDA